MQEKHAIANSQVNFFQRLWTKYPLGLLFFIQSIFLFTAFPQILLQPTEYMLCNYNDGMRQYFFYQSYLEQDPELGWAKSKSMGYPYGEYVLFTDATPLLAISLKFFSRYILDISEYGIFLFNLFILFGHFLSSFFLYKILKKLEVDQGLRFFFALCLPWLGIEFFKITQGHLNLSISWPLLGTIYFLQRIMGLVQYSRSKNRLYIWSSMLGFLLFFIGLIHLYWIVMAALLIGVFIIGLIIIRRQYRTDVFRIVNAGTLCLLVPVLVLGLLVRISDGYFEDRLSHGEGYGWEHWVLQFEGLFTSHAHNTIPFILEDSALYSFGSFAYIGNFALYGILILLLEGLVLKKVRLYWKTTLSRDKQLTFLWLFGIGTFVSLMISLGETLYIQRLDLYITNYLNPFYYLHLLTDRVTQIRDVSRFSFIVFWFSNILLIYLVNLRLKFELPKYWVYGATGMLLLFCVVDTTDSFRLARKEMNRPNLLNPQADAQIFSLSQKIDPQNYQAMIPIPFNHEGAGDNHYVIDGFDDFLTNSLQFQRATKIPLLSAKFARGNYEHAKRLFSLFGGRQMLSEQLLKDLTNKPILVLYNADFYNGEREIRGNQLEPAWSTLQNCHKIIEEYQMKELAREGNFVLYEWEIGLLK